MKPETLSTAACQRPGTSAALRVPPTMKIQMMPRTATIHMAELVKLTSNPPADSGATSWISNCARGLCATASTLVFILPAVLADTGYLPNIPECRAHAQKEQDEQEPRARDRKSTRLK